MIDSPGDGTPLRVLHVAETAKGGVGSYIDDVAAVQLGRYGEGAVRVVVPDAHALQLRRVPESAQRRFPVATWRPLNAVRMVGAARAQIRDWRPDVVHLQSSFAGWALRPVLALRRRRPRIVYCAHGWAFEREGRAGVNRALAWVERRWSRWCDVIVCVSPSEVEAGVRAGIERSRLVLVNNGVPDVESVGDVPSARSSWPPGVRRVLFVGRLDRQKGVDVLFEAMRRLGGRAFTVVVGTSVVADGEVLGQPDNVRVMGWLAREEIAAYYAAAEVVVIPSRWEGLSLVALEALRSGRPIVAARVGGMEDVVNDGENGLLVPVEDPEAVASAIAGLDDETLLAMGAASRARYEARFRIERVVEELDSVYRANDAGPVPGALA